MCGREFITTARLRRGLQAGRKISAPPSEPPDKQHYGFGPKARRGVFSSLSSHTTLEESSSYAAHRCTDFCYRCHPLQKRKKKKKIEETCKSCRCAMMNAFFFLNLTLQSLGQNDDNYNIYILEKKNPAARRKGRRIATIPRNSFSKHADKRKCNK